tara:strand:+ start:491 stop:688 length:198 start_codon:yes stop_codon:yes gene_type:complete
MNERSNKIINISFTKNEGELLKILDELVKYDMSTNRSGWFKDQIRRRFYEMRKDGIMVAADDKEE